MVLRFAKFYKRLQFQYAPPQIIIGSYGIKPFLGLLLLQKEGKGAAL